MQAGIHIRASVPEAIESDVMQELNRLDGKITSIEREQHSRTAIRATVPKKSVADFRAWLKSYSSGQGFLSEDEA
jgi:translation elongation factor EF-G